MLLFEEIFDWLHSYKKLKVHKHLKTPLLLCSVGAFLHNRRICNNICSLNQVLIFSYVSTFQYCASYQQFLSFDVEESYKCCFLIVSQICYVHKENLDSLSYQTSTFVQKEIYVVIMWKVYGNCHIYWWTKVIHSSWWLLRK